MAAVLRIESAEARRPYERGALVGPACAVGEEVLDVDAGHAARGEAQLRERRACTHSAKQRRLVHRSRESTRAAGQGAVTAAGEGGPAGAHGDEGGGAARLTVGRHDLVLLEAVDVVGREHGRAGHGRGQPRQQPLARAGQQLRTAPGTARGGEGPQRRSTGAGSRREAGAQARERPGWRGAGPGRPRAREERAHSEGGPLQCASCWPLPDRK